MLPFKYVVFLALVVGLFMLSLFYVWKQDMINQIGVNSVTCSTAAEPKDTGKPVNMTSQYSAEAGLGVLLEEAPEQQLIPNAVLMKTAKFMIEERDQYDEELVAFVRSLIVVPPKADLYTKKGTQDDVSQLGQSTFIDTALGSKRNGFFIEAGAWDGETISNTLFFELERNWTGILIEPLPSLFQSAVKKRRRAFVLNACLSSDERTIVAKIRVANVLSGRVSAMNVAHQQRIENEFGKKRPNVYVPCFPLNTILRAMGVQNVDYFSLDIEGGELEVLRHIDYGQFIIQSLTVEHNGYQGMLNNLIALMVTKMGYKSAKQDGQDIYLIKENKN